VNHQDILNNINNLATVNSMCDICMVKEMMRLVVDKTPLRIIKLTKSGMVYCEDINDTRKKYTIPPRNLDLMSI